MFKACRKYELFHGWSHRDASEEVVDKSSLTVAGWADAVVHDWIDIDSARLEFERSQDEQHRRKLSSCWVFGTTKGDLVTEHNEHVARLISGLGRSSAGRRAVLRFVAKRQGSDDDDIVEDMPLGPSDLKITVPSGFVEHSMRLDFLTSWLPSTF